MLNLEGAGGEARLRNGGFDGIVIKAGEAYNLSLFARVLAGNFEALKVRLESRTGELLGEVALAAPTTDWTKFTAVITPTAADRFARLVLVIAGRWFAGAGRDLAVSAKNLPQPPERTAG